VVARRGAEAHGEYPGATKSDVATSRAAARSEGLTGDAVRDTGRPIGKRNSARGRGDGRSSATAPVQDLSKGGNTPETVPACHSASLLNFLAVAPPGPTGEEQARRLTRREKLFSGSILTSTSVVSGSAVFTR
jgi:hypothetical protein